MLSPLKLIVHNRLRQTLLIALLVVFAGGSMLLAQTPEPGGAPGGEPAAIEQSGSGERPNRVEDAPGAERESVWEFLRKGGVTMFGLGIISTVILAFALERFFFFRRQQISTRGFYERLELALQRGGMEEVEKMLQGEELLIARVLRSGMAARKGGQARFEKALELSASVEIGKLERGLNLLNNLGNIAPLLGFFGTVTGMRNSFLQFTEKAAPTARDLAGGVEEALITTITGLLIAIPAYFIYNMFLYKIDSLTIEIERSAALVTSQIEE